MRKSAVVFSFASHVPFSKEVGKVNRKPVTLPRIERPGIPIYRKLHPGLDPNRAVHSEHAGTKKKLLSSTARQVQVLPLQRASSLASKLSKDAPIPTRIIGAPREGTVAVNGRVGEQVRPAIAIRFGVALITCAYPRVLAPRRDAGDSSNQVTGSAVQAPV